jgi:subtilisin family serine protease
VRAAGNNGPAYSSLFSQAVAKSILTVGAHLNSYEAFQNMGTFLNPEELAEELLELLCAYAEINDVEYNWCLWDSDMCCEDLNSTYVDPYSYECCPAYINYTYSASNFANDPLLYNEHNIASFSSRGPTQEGRIKPDVMGPGEWVTSSRASGLSYPHCSGAPAYWGSPEANHSLLVEQGTSMATANVAGSATLLR